MHLRCGGGLKDAAHTPSLRCARGSPFGLRVYPLTDMGVRVRFCLMALRRRGGGNLTTCHLPPATCHPAPLPYFPSPAFTRERVAKS